MANFLSRVRNALVPNVRAPVAPMLASDIVGYGGYGTGGGGWWPLIREPFAGAWQRNLEIRHDHVVMNVTVFRCVSLISTDIAKMRMKLEQQNSDGIWIETPNPAWSPVINKPNHFQNMIQFFENWVNSKMNAGNTYILKERDNRNVVVALYILDPRRVRPLVADNGDVYYQLHTDNLAGITETNVTVPASEIIHDRWNCFFHPLCGLSPIVANGLVATQGLRIQEHSAQFFKNGANPGGILTAPSKIDTDTAERLKVDWQERFTGANVGFVAILGSGLEYKPMAITPIDAQLIDQLKWSAETIAASYGVPAYKAGVGPMPTASINIDALETQYFQSCLQIHIQSIEMCLDQGLGLPNNWTVEFDLDDLLRMDAAAKMKYLSDGVSAALIAPNEGRARLGYSPKKGGEALYLQQQNYSLEALAKRDASDDPFAFGKGTPQAAPTPAQISAPNNPNPNPTPNNTPTPDQTNSLKSDFARKIMKHAY